MDPQFAAFVRARQNAWLRAAYLICGDQTQAEDLTQEAVIKLARVWERIRDDNPDAYLRRILYRDMVSGWRSRTRERRAVHRLASIAQPAGLDPAEASIGLDVQRALSQLAPRQRAVLVLRFFEDRTERETAELLGVSVGTVKSQAHDALARMRQLLPGLDLHASIDAAADPTEVTG